MTKLYVKIYCDEGVIKQEKFDTEWEANAYIAGFKAAKDLTSAEDEDQLDYYSICSDDKPAKDES